MLEVSDITKTYGTRTVVDRVSFSVPKGEILGFLGPNGAGKTTTMRLITGYVPPSSGTAKVAGFDVQEQPLEVKRRLGYLPEHPPLYPEMLVRPYLEFVARIRAVPRRQIKARVDRAIERCGLQAVAGRLIGVLSKGFQQRVGLAQAILHEPDLLILDEPTNGLDIPTVHGMRDILRGMKDRGTCILFSSHVLEEVRALCDQIVVIARGRVVASGDVSEICRSTGRASLEDAFLALTGRVEVTC
jgi:gliding motility-associated transport system ATP-binding protein